MVSPIPSAPTGLATFTFLPIVTEDGSFQFVSDTLLKAYMSYLKDCNRRQSDPEPLGTWLGTSAPVVERGRMN
jgi:hypothetical protein